MTNNNSININENKKKFILEWASKELKDGSMRYEKFKVVVGSSKEYLLFYSTFFVDNNFQKKGEIYELVTPGNFVEDSTGIIQGIDNGGYEWNKITPTLLIKTLWEKGEKLDLAEKDLREKKEYVDKLSQETKSAKNETAELKKNFNILQDKKEKDDQKIKLLEEELARKKEAVEKENQKWTNSQEEIVRINTQLTSLKTEKDNLENKWISPERQEKDKKAIKDLESNLDIERKRKQVLVERLEEIRNQEWKVTIESKLQEKKVILNQLKITAEDKLESNQKVFLEMLLITQEQLDNLLFEGVDARICLPMKNQLEQHKKTLESKLNAVEIDSLRMAKTEVMKLEAQLNQWEKIQLQQEYVEVPPK